MTQHALFEVADRILAVARQIRFADAAAHESITPLETSVMRFIDKNPGASAKAAAEASLLTASNFSRALRSLESRGFVRRETDPADGRSVRLYPTDRAAENLNDLRARWTALLTGTISSVQAEQLAALLAQLEEHLARRGAER